MASVAVKGDFARLKSLTSKLKDLVGAGPFAALNKSLAEEALHQVKQEFRAQRDPYEEPWAKLKHRRGRILRDTGRLANGWSRISASRSGFVIGNATSYASIHQRGATYTKRGGPATRFKGRFVSGKRFAERGFKKNGQLRKGYSATAHGDAKVTIPARPMVPSEARGLGGLWTGAFARVTRRVLRKQLKG